ncbi:MAG: hypothetical protein NTV98_00985, partial [Candidatus Roizmanbacteria bacterium]|nr:hypothetical protein [Candidatus Roizmanbacteria bacterium]
MKKLFLFIISFFLFLGVLTYLKGGVSAEECTAGLGGSDCTGTSCLCHNVNAATGKGTCACTVATCEGAWGTCTADGAKCYETRWCTAGGKQTRECTCPGGGGGGGGG